ncbi:MAG: N-acetylmuramoyl-L-alanine amidase [Dehalococcoidales bacterium]
MDNITGLLDETPVTIGPDTLPQLREIDTHTCQRWEVNASVEAVLRGDAEPQWTRGMGWSHDPVISCWAERQTPADLYLSVHQNWMPSSRFFGPVVLHCTGSIQGRKYARTVFGSIADSMGAWGADAGIEWGTPERDEYIARGGRGQLTNSRLHELRRTRAPAVLVELGFQSNEGDRALMANPDWRARMAQAIVDGLPVPG